MSFGARLKALRIKEGLTQERLAGELGVTKRTLINYETGKCTPKNTELFYAAAKRFGVSVDYLMTESDEFVAEAYASGGGRAGRDAERLIGEIGGMFAGGELAEEDKDAVMRAIQDAYWTAKEKNRKYAPKKYRQVK